MNQERFEAWLRGENKPGQRSQMVPNELCSDEQLLSLRGLAVQLTVARLEDVFRDAAAKAALESQFDEKPDPRWREIQIRSLMGIASVMGVSRGVPVPERTEAPEVSRGPDEAVLRERVVQLLSSVSPSSSLVSSD